jgi:hypothetical protein
MQRVVLKATDARSGRGSNWHEVESGFAYGSQARREHLCDQESVHQVPGID